MADSDSASRTVFGYRIRLRSKNILLLLVVIAIVVVMWLTGHIAIEYGPLSCTAWGPEATTFWCGIEGKTITGFMLWFLTLAFLLLGRILLPIFVAVEHAADAGGDDDAR